MYSIIATKYIIEIVSIMLKRYYKNILYNKPKYIIQKQPVITAE